MVENQSFGTRTRTNYQTHTPWLPNRPRALVRNATNLRYHVFKSFKTARTETSTKISNRTYGPTNENRQGHCRCLRFFKTGASPPARLWEKHSVNESLLDPSNATYAIALVDTYTWHSPWLTLNCLTSQSTLVWTFPKATKNQLICGTFRHASNMGTDALLEKIFSIQLGNSDVLEFMYKNGEFGNSEIHFAMHAKNGALIYLPLTEHWIRVKLGNTNNY